MSTYLASLASFTPQRILRLANNDPASIAVARVDRFPAAVRFADISGFTALTERLTAQGPSGAEDLTHVLNLYFGQMIDLIGEYGGDVVKFAGDALIALWPASDATGIVAHVERIAQCSLVMQARLHNQEVADGLRLSMKLAIGAGEVLWEHLGGVFDRWEFLIAGQPLVQVGIANGHASPGDIVVSAEAWCLIAQAASGSPLADGAVRLTRLARTLTIEPPAALAPRPEIAPALRAFIPGAIRGRLDAGHTDWLGELRRISLMFINLPDFNVDTPLDTAHRAMQALQTALYRFEGSINKISVDDKGASLIAVLGLPPLAHEDDPERALRAAMAMQAGLTTIDFKSAIGVTTGLAFCGVVGNTRRREYTVMGDVVNLAARLMQAARGGILCDKATALASGHRVALEALPAIKVKGKTLPIEIWRPSASAPVGSSRKPETRKVGIIGRLAERSAMTLRLDTLVRTGVGGCIVLEAEAGMGKARLLQEFLGLAQDRAILGLVGSGDAIETTIAYRAWRQVFETLFPIDPTQTEPGAQQTLLSALLPALPRLIELTPLIEAVLPMQWPDNDITRPLTGKARAQRTQDLLVGLLQHAARQKPLLLVVKDVVWLDSASWSVLLRVAREVERLVLVVSSRPLGQDAPAAYAQLLALPGTARIELPPLSDDDIAALVRLRLGIDSVPELLAQVVRERAEGNPMFAEELVLGLRDGGVIEIVGRECRMLGAADALSATKLPTTVEGILTARIDRLTPAEQITMKVASVVGRVFDPATLSDIHPIPSPRPDVDAHCATLDRLELAPLVKGSTLLQAASDVRSYKFKSNLAREVAYSLMLFSQRRELHHKLALWLETNTDTNRPEIVTLLAYHWRMAAQDRVPQPAMVERAVGYHEQAARHAIRAYANREAIDLLRQAITLVQTLPDNPSTAAAELRLQLELGPALVAATHYGAPEVQALYDRARGLCRLGGDPGQLFRALRGLWQYQIGQSQYDLARATGDEMQLLAEQAHDTALQIEAHRVLGNTAFWTGNFPAASVFMERAVALYDPVRHQALAVELGQDPDVANRGILSWALCFLGRPQAAGLQVRIALERAELLGHPFSRVFAGGSAMWSGWFLDQPELAAQHAAATRDLSLERGFPYLAAAAKVVHGWALARSGQPDQGLSEVEAAVTAWRASGVTIGMVIFLQVLADAQILAGHGARALATLDDPIILARIGTEVWRQGDQARLRGQALAAVGQVDAAVAVLADCETAAVRQGARLTALRALTVSCQLNAGDCVQRRERLREALASFPEQSDNAPVRHARMVLGLEPQQMQAGVGQ